MPSHIPSLCFRTCTVSHMTACVWCLPQFRSSRSFTARAAPTTMAWSAYASSTRSSLTLMRYEKEHSGCRFETFLFLIVSYCLSLSFCPSLNSPRWRRLRQLAALTWLLRGWRSHRLEMKTRYLPSDTHPYTWIIVKNGITGWFKVK